ncbi:hypothetical protein C8J57DRAFT_1297432 [Mycena rebaudengoi]|nr:hypothetical protein C8J57DRAFT_1297432 [Mycena rebaudengoi]
MRRLCSSTIASLSATLCFRVQMRALASSSVLTMLAISSLPFFTTAARAALRAHIAKTSRVLRRRTVASSWAMAALEWRSMLIASLSSLASSCDTNWVYERLTNTPLEPEARARRGRRTVIGHRTRAMNDNTSRRRFMLLGCCRLWYC